jgi:hypothetical protein
MAVAFKKTRISAQQQGVNIITMTIDVPAGADQSVAFVFPTPFAAVPRMLGAPARVDANAVDVISECSISPLTAVGGTIRQKGTTGVIKTWDVTFIGDLNNPTAY